MNDRGDKVRLTVFKASDFRSLRNVALGDPPPALPPAKRPAINTHC